MGVLFAVVFAVQLCRLGYRWHKNRGSEVTLASYHLDGAWQSGFRWMSCDLRLVQPPPGFRGLCLRLKLNGLRLHTEWSPNAGWCTQLNLTFSQATEFISLLERVYTEVRR